MTSMNEHADERTAAAVRYPVWILKCIAAPVVDVILLIKIFKLVSATARSPGNQCNATGIEWHQSTSTRTNEPQRLCHPVWILKCIAAPVVDVIPLIEFFAAFVDPASVALVREAECVAVLCCGVLRALLCCIRTL